MSNFSKRWIAVLSLLWIAAASATARKSVPDSTKRVHASTRDSQGSIQASFLNPPEHCRILKIIHSWPDDAVIQDETIGTLTNQGFGGVVCNISFEDYLQSEKKWQSFIRAVSSAKNAGLNLWLYDERGYPSGTAGGQVLKSHLDWAAEGLLVNVTETTGDSVDLLVPPGELVLAVGLPLLTQGWSLAGQMDVAWAIKTNRLKWLPPAGRWKVVVITQSRLFEGTHAALNLAEKQPYINLLMPEPTAQFIQATHQQYADRIHPNLGRFFEATFTDEPSLMSLFLEPMPYRVLPWSPHFKDEFRRKRGYAIEPWLTALVADVGPQTARIRYHFWLTVGEMVSENYFGQIQRWCRAHGIPSGGHLLMEEGLGVHVPLYGHFFKCLRRLDAPSIDCLTSIPAEVPWHIARLVASAAELENRPLVMCEVSDHSQVYRPAGDQRPPRIVTEDEIRGTLNRLMLNGINRFTSYYSFRGLSHAQLRRLNEYAGRSCLWLEGGCQVADIAVLYPTESLWARFEPSRHYANDSIQTTQIETIYRNTLESLYAEGRDFTVLDGQALSEARVSRGTLCLGSHRWQVVILPGADTLPLPAWRTLWRFARSGGILICIGRLPANSETAFPCPTVQSLFAPFFSAKSGEPSFTQTRGSGVSLFLPRGFEHLLGSILDKLIEPGASASATAPMIHVTHRRKANCELFFVINDSNQPWAGSMDFCAAGSGQIWNPMTGLATTVGQPSKVELSLGSYEARLLAFPTARNRQRYRATDNLLPRLQHRILPLGAPSLVQGEHVRARVLPEAGSFGQPAWQVRAQITRSNVDVYCFAVFPVLSGASLTGTAALAIDSWAPNAQPAPTQLLVILHEQGGADYLASLGRSLGAGGYDHSLVSFSRMQLAGWSADSNGKLDLDKIVEIRVGWGGYFGTAQEWVDFSVANPMAVGEKAAMALPY